MSKKGYIMDKINNKLRSKSSLRFYKSKKGKKLKKLLSELSSGKNNPNYKDGRCCNSHHCIDCDIEIDKIGRSIRCPECYIKTMKGKNHPMYGKHHTKKSKIIIGIKSKNKFTKKFKEKQRKIFEKMGLWIPLDKIKPYALYCRKSNWKKNMFNYLSSKELKLLKKKGLFSYKNTKGMVRDHKYSRYFGFINKIPPIILRHPANCQLITHSENLSKAKKGHRYQDENSITLKQLFQIIKNFKQEWYEQTKCLKIIKKYKIKHLNTGDILL